MELLTKHLKKKHIEHIYLYVCLSIISVSCLIFGYWLFYPMKVIEFNKEVKTDRTEYKPGDRITYTISYCKYKNVSGVLLRALVNGTRTEFTPARGNMDMGCHTINRSDLVIPDYSDNGIYHLEATAEYKVNPVRKITVSWSSNEFIIKK